LTDINFEKICVLYCIAALQSAIGAISNYNSDEGLKAAAKHFQGAAVTFRAAASMVHKFYTNPPSNDLNPTLLNSLHVVMLVRSL
jgi:programmed cell death 6-interacting protein